MTTTRRTRGRTVNGLLLLDKPSGITSNQALQRVKRIFEARKAGHTGSLDKAASGLLPLCFGHATKLSQYLLDSDKRYRAVCRLGVTTTTGDAEGDEMSVSEVPEISDHQLNLIKQQFTGLIDQIPPMHSALKQNGERLYKLAYQGINVERKSRQVRIHQLEITDISGHDLEIDVVCSKGTYIRTLAEDIGQLLGCGAHVKSLRRTAVGSYDLGQAISIETLEQVAKSGMEALDDLLHPPDRILNQLPDIVLNEAMAFYLSQGQAVLVPNAPTEGKVRIYNKDMQFIGIGIILDDGRVAPKRLFAGV